jgi:hypothetical protein
MRLKTLASTRDPLGREIGVDGLGLLAHAYDLRAHAGFAVGETAEPSTRNQAVALAEVLASDGTLRDRE